MMTSEATPRHVGQNDQLGPEASVASAQVAAERERIARLCEQRAESTVIDDREASVWLSAAELIRNENAALKSETTAEKRRAIRPRSEILKEQHVRAALLALTVEKGATLKAAGSEFGVTPERARQALASSIRRAVKAGYLDWKSGYHQVGLDALRKMPEVIDALGRLAPPQEAITTSNVEITGPGRNRSNDD